MAIFIRNQIKRGGDYPIFFFVYYFGKVKNFLLISNTDNYNTQMSKDIILDALYFGKMKTISYIVVVTIKTTIL